MWEAFAEEKEPSESADGSAAEVAKEKPRQLSKTRVNHLGVPLHSLCCSVVGKPNPTRQLHLGPSNQG